MPNEKDKTTVASGPISAAQEDTTHPLVQLLNELNISEVQAERELFAKLSKKLREDPNFLPALLNPNKNFYKEEQLEVWCQACKDFHSLNTLEKHYPYGLYPYYNCNKSFDFLLFRVVERKK